MAVLKDNQVKFPHYGKKTLTVNFEGGEISSDAELFFIRQSDEALGLTGGLARIIHTRQ
ncbi:MAG: hypothetical protein GF315_15170 [candidate division Zixibacteria bacterium]|nr:hypothetical protein [candidate division Zixibacteria bacterium]